MKLPSSSALALSIVAALSLTACGGGGSNVKSSPAPSVVPTPTPTPAPPPPPPTAPAPAPPTSPAPAPAPAPPTAPVPAPPPPPPPPPPNPDPDITTPTGTGRTEATDHLSRTVIKLDEALKRGLTGAGVKVAIYESDVANWETLKGKNLGQIDEDPLTTNIFGGDSDHGAKVATVLVGSRVGEINNGIAPGAKFYWFDRNSVTNLNAVMKSGARIINISMTTNGAQLDSMSADAMAQYSDYLKKSGEEATYRAIQNANILVVRAVGNTGGATARAGDALPAFIDGLNNWLLVAALDDDGKTLATWASACGERAKEFCLSAPGSYQITNPKDPSKTILISGSSFATPIVSGVAALVMEAFPWMTAQQVAQTLLTTATDLGDPGVDAIYGRGRVDADKATKGPGVLTATFEAAVPTGVGAVFSNDISGTGGLTKTGGGTLTLTGSNTFSGDVTLNDGKLSIHGNVEGNFAQNGGTLLVDGSRGMHINGNASITQIDMTSSKWLGSKWRGEILTAGSLDASSLQNANRKLFYSQNFIASSNSLTADLTRRAGTLTGLGDQSTLQALRGVDATLTAADHDTRAQQRLASIAMMDIDATSQIILDSVAGQAHATSRAMALEASDIQHQWSLRRAHEAADSKRGGVWGMAGNFDSKIRPSNAFSVDVRHQQLSGGVDHRFNDQLIVGVSGNLSHIRSEFNRFGGNVTTQGTGLMTYAALQLSSQLTFTGYFGATQLRNDVERAILANGGSMVQSDTRANAYSAGAAAHWLVRPSLRAGLSLQHETLRSDGFVENGTSSLELSARSSTTRRNALGIDVQYDSPRHSPGGWETSIGAGYRRLLGTPDTGFDASYAVTPNALFRIDGAAMARDAFWTNAGVGYRFSSNLLYVRTDIRTDRDHTAPAISIGYRREL